MLGAGSEQETLRIHKYHVNEQLTERFKRNSMKEDSWFNAKQRKGIVMHKLLETLSGTEDLDKLISEKVQEGISSGNRKGKRSDRQLGMSWFRRK
jgi:hypothetical protein